MLHLEVKLHRMERDFRLKVRVGKPRVSYRETDPRETRTEGASERQIGTTPVSARVVLRLQPNKSGKSRYLSATRSPSTTSRHRHWPRWSQGIRWRRRSGYLGYPVINLRVSVEELSDSPRSRQRSMSRKCRRRHRTRSNKALRDNMTPAGADHRVEVAVPEESLGPVTADLNAPARRSVPRRRAASWWVVETPCRWQRCSTTPTVTGAEPRPRQFDDGAAFVCGGARRHAPWLFRGGAYWKALPEHARPTGDPVGRLFS